MILLQDGNWSRTEDDAVKRNKTTFIEFIWRDNNVYHELFTVSLRERSDVTNYIKLSTWVFAFSATLYSTTFHDNIN